MVRWINHCQCITACGSTPRTYSLYNKPIQPGGITGPATNVCPAGGVTSASYSIAAVAGATSYSWTVPSGMTILGSSTGTSINVQVGSGFTGGNVCVAAVGTCGAGPSRCLPVTTKTATPGTISGPLSVCASQTGVAYSVSAVANATGYSWSITGGASIIGSGSSATVSFNTATSTSAQITVNALNACGASSPSRLTVAVNLLCRESMDGSADIALTAFPNPSQGKITVAFDAPADGRYSMRVVDLLGKSVINNDLNAVAGHNVQEIDLSGVAKGIYLLNVQSEGGDVQTLRLVLE